MMYCSNSKVLQSWILIKNRYTSLLIPSDISSWYPSIITARGFLPVCIHQFCPYSWNPVFDAAVLEIPLTLMCAAWVLLLPGLHFGETLSSRFSVSFVASRCLRQLRIHNPQDPIVPPGILPSNFSDGRGTWRISSWT